jgi:hypothetical protein
LATAGLPWPGNKEFVVRAFVGSGHKSDVRDFATYRKEVIRMVGWASLALTSEQYYGKREP